MKIYVDHSPSSGEWDKTSVLELSDDGRFSYHETLTTHAGTLEGKAEGSWRQHDGSIFLLPDQVEGVMEMRWIASQEWMAYEKDDHLTFSGSFTLYLREEK